MTPGLISHAYAAYLLNTACRVRSVGEFMLHGQETGTEKIADFPEIFWCVEGKGSFLLHDSEHTLLPEQVFYYPQGSHHVIRCTGKCFNYRWLSMEGPGAAALMDGLNLKPGVNQASACPAELFSTVAAKLWIPSPAAQLEALADAMRIIVRAVKGPLPKASDIAEKAAEIMNLHFSDAELNVESLAEMLHTNRVTLSRAFSRSKKVSVIDYLQGLRFRRAVHLLQNTGCSIQEIASVCGYANANYFAKFIRKRTGSSPSQIREQSPRP